jgi:hypothetical protein
MDIERNGLSQAVVRLKCITEDQGWNIFGRSCYVDGGFHRVLLSLKTNPETVT